MTKKQILGAVFLSPLMLTALTAFVYKSIKEPLFFLIVLLYLASVVGGLLLTYRGNNESNQNSN